MTVKSVKISDKFKNSKIGKICKKWKTICKMKKVIRKKREKERKKEVVVKCKTKSNLICACARSMRELILIQSRVRVLHHLLEIEYGRRLSQKRNAA